MNEKIIITNQEQEKKENISEIPSLLPLRDVWMENIKKMSSIIRMSDIKKGDPEIHLIQSEINKKSLDWNFDSSMIHELMIIIASLIAKNKIKDNCRIPKNGKASICEIGGPTYSSTQKDITFSKAAKYVSINPSFKMVAGGNIFFHPIALKNGIYSLNPLLEDNVINISSSFEDADLGEAYFDYITAYAVFGSENSESFSDSNLGPDLSSHEKRMAILTKIAGKIKKNGLFMINVLSRSSSFWAVSDEEAKKYGLKTKNEGSFDISPDMAQSGFKPTEIKEAGFEIITPVPYNRMFIFQYIGKNN